MNLELNMADHPRVAYEPTVRVDGSSLVTELVEFIADDEYEANYFSMARGLQYLADKRYLHRSTGGYPQDLAAPRIGFRIPIIGSVKNHKFDPEVWTTTTRPRVSEAPFDINPKTNRIRRVKHNA